MLKSHDRVLASLSRLDMPIFSYLLSYLTSKGIMLSTVATVYGTGLGKKRKSD